jgi:hypothetical protein
VLLLLQLIALSGTLMRALLQLSNLGAVLWIKRRFCDGIGVLTHSGRTTTTD